jgi:hypothetical protein
VWDWDIVWDGYTPDSKIVKKEGTIPFYRLINDRGDILAERGSWKTLYIIPRVMFDWTAHLNMMDDVTSQSSVDINIKLKSVVPDHYPRFVGYIDPLLGDEGIKRAREIPGALLKDIDYAVIGSNYLGNEGVGRKISEERHKHPELFYVSADISLENPDGNKIQVLSQNSRLDNIIIR